MDEIEATRRRTQAYWYADGAAEIAGGVALTVVGGLLLYGSLLARAGRGDAVSNVALLVMIVAFPMTAALVRWFKSRVTYPRTGYVGYAEPNPKRRILAATIGLGVAVAVMSFSLARTAQVAGFVTAAVALVAGVSFAVHAYRTGIRRFYVRAVVVVVVGLLWGLRATDYAGGLGGLWLALGVTSVGTGVWALASYLRANRGVAGDAA